MGKAPLRSWDRIRTQRATGPRKQKKESPGELRLPGWDSLIVLSPGTGSTGACGSARFTRYAWRGLRPANPAMREGDQRISPEKRRTTWRFNSKDHDAGTTPTERWGMLETPLATLAGMAGNADNSPQLWRGRQGASKSPPGFGRLASAWGSTPAFRSWVALLLAKPGGGCSAKRASR